MEHRRIIAFVSIIKTLLDTKSLNMYILCCNYGIKNKISTNNYLQIFIEKMKYINYLHINNFFEQKMIKQYRLLYIEFLKNDHLLKQKITEIVARYEYFLLKIQYLYKKKYLASNKQTLNHTTYNAIIYNLEQNINAILNEIHIINDNCQVINLLMENKGNNDLIYKQIYEIYDFFLSENFFLPLLCENRKKNIKTLDIFYNVSENMLFYNDLLTLLNDNNANESKKYKSLFKFYKNEQYFLFFQKIYLFVSSVYFKTTNNYVALTYNFPHYESLFLDSLSNIILQSSLFNNNMFNGSTTSQQYLAIKYVIVYYKIMNIITFQSLIKKHNLQNKDLFKECLLYIDFDI